MEVWVWLVAEPVRGVVVVGFVVLMAVGTALNQQSTGEREEFNRSVERCVSVAAGVLGRYAAGRDLRAGEPRSSASWWRAGVLVRPDLTAEEIASRGAGRERGAGKPARDAAAGGGRWWQVPVGAVHGLVLGPGQWCRWPHAGRVAVRLVLPAAVASWWWAPSVAAGLGCGLVLLALGAAVSGPRALGWWAPRPATDGQIYGPSIWATVRELLRVPEEARRVRWLSVPDDLDQEGARIVLRVPVEWHGPEAAMRAVETAVAVRIPGQWSARWHRVGVAPYVEWTCSAPVPAPAVLPEFVPWRSTGKRHEVFVGQALEDGKIRDVLIQTESATPHWGVAGNTGAGKSTVLYIGVVHARMYGGLVDILDTKQNSMYEADGKSGVRIHKSVPECVGAFAEFMLSMQAAETAKGKDSDPALRSLLVPRTLVIDELPTLIKLSYIWWRYGIGGKGVPPFLEWFAVALLQGRSADHKVIVGTQQFANKIFGGTMERDQIGWKAIVGYQDRVSWGVAFGQSVVPLPIDTRVKGRGAFADMQIKPGGDQLWVREFQPCYITPEVSSLLNSCAPAPAWFDAGEMAPWITAEALERAEALAVPAFLPGGLYGPSAPGAPSGVPSVSHTGGGEGSGRSEKGTPGLSPDHGTARGTLTDTPEAEVGARLPAVYSIAEACAAGILPWGYETARRYRLRGIKRGIEFPAGITDGRTHFYSETELKDWLERWQRTTR